LKYKYHARIHWKFSGTNRQPLEVFHFFSVPAGWKGNYGAICKTFPFLLLAILVPRAFASFGHAVSETKGAVKKNRGALGTRMACAACAANSSPYLIL